MNNNEKKSVYMNLLEGFGYSPAEVERYFDKTISSLEKDLFDLKEKQSDDYRDIYEDYETRLQKHDENRVIILQKYFKDYEALNEKANVELIALLDEYYKEKQDLESRIEFEEVLLERIRHSFVRTLYEAKSRPLAHKRQIENKIDKEEEVYTYTIFNAKESILKNLEFYKNAEKHALDIKKLITFLEEFKNYTSSLTENATLTSIESSRHLSDIYIECFEDAKKLLSDTSKYVSKFDSIRSSFNTFINIIIKNKKDNSDECESIKKGLEELNKKKDADIEALNKYYDSLIEKATNKEKSLLLEQKSSLINFITTNNQKLLIKYSIELDLLNKQNEELNRYSSILKDARDHLFESYNNFLDNGKSLMLNTFSSIIEILNYQKNALGNLTEDAKRTKDLLYYYKKSYESLGLDAKIVSLKEYLTYIEDNVNQNKELDLLSFKLLTNDELLRLSLLDLRRQYLTIDDETEIKKIEYDIKRKELEETAKAELEIMNSKCDLVLLKKDYEIDVLLVKNRLNNEVKILDTNKNIEMLKCDYMAAYTRLENISKIVKIKDRDEDAEEKLKTQIQIQKILEIAYLEAISRNEQFEDLMERYNKGIEILDEQLTNKMRYLNNVLEIERNNFEANKIKVLKESDEAKKRIYPFIRTEKESLKSKMDHIRESIKESQAKVIEEYRASLVNEKRAHALFVMALDKCKSSLLDLSPKTEFNEYVKKVDTDQILNQVYYILDTLVIDLDNILNKIYNKSFTKAYNKKELYKDYKTFRSLFIKSKNTSSLHQAYKYLLRSANESVKMLKKAFNKELKKNAPISYSEYIRNVFVLEDLKEYLLVKEIEKTSSDISPFLDNLDTIDIAKENDSERLAKRLSDYQELYLRTVKTIENDYKEKINHINTLKTRIIKQRETGNEDIKNIINSTYLAYIKRRDERIGEKKQENASNISSSHDKTTDLSRVIENINGNFQEEKQKILDEGNKYFDLMKDNSLKLWDSIETFKQDNKNKLEKRIIDHDQNKAAYFDELNSENIRLKDSFEYRKNSIIEKYENLKADNLIEFEEKFNNVIADTLNKYDNVSIPISAFKEHLSSLNEKLNEDLNDSLNNMENRINSLITEFKDKMEKK